MSRRRTAVGVLATALAVAAAAVAVGPEAQGQGTAVCGSGNAVIKDGRFTIVQRPAGLEQITAHAVGGADGQLILATDGSRVMRSTNGGCSWKQAYDASSPAADVIGKVTQILLPENDPGRAYIVLSGVGDAVAPSLLTSFDGGETWGASSTGLPAAGRYRRLVAAPDAPRTLYLEVGQGDAASTADDVGVTGVLYASEDGGETWQERSRGTAIVSFKVDPIEAKELWVVRANHTVHHSGDGGANWDALAIPDDTDPNDPTPLSEADSTPDHTWREIIVAHELPFGPVVFVLASATPEGSITRGVVTLDEGKKDWIEIGTDNLGPVGGGLVGRSDTQIYYASGSPSTAFHGPGLLELDVETLNFDDIDDLDLISLQDPQAFAATAGGTLRYRAFSFRRDAPGEDPPLPDVIVRYDPPEPDPGRSLGRHTPCSDDAPKPADVKVRPIEFQPGKVQLKLQPGVPVRTDLKAKLPASPSPLDVYFLMDQSTSMDPAIEGLFCSVGRMARDLPARGIDAYFGIGSYSDYFLNSYKRVLDITEPGPEIIAALKTMYTYGGVDEPMRTALFQTATGKGLQATARDPNGQGVLGGNNSSSVDRKVDPEQQANFRDDALRLALVIGDEPYEEDTGGEPSREEVVAALRDKKIMSVGVHVRTSLQTSARDAEHSPQRQLALRQQLEYFARETGAVAPKGGIDCDGGGAPDIQAGQPLVCSILEKGIQRQIDDTLITLLRGVEDRQDVRIEPAKTGGLAVAVEQGSYAQLNVKKPNALAAVGVVSCSTEQAGRSYEIAFDVFVARRKVGRLDGVAQCGELAQPVPAAPQERKESPETAPAPKPVKPAPVAPAAPAPPSTPPAPAAQVGVAVAPPPPPPAPAPAGSVQIQPMTASAPASAAAPAPGQGAAAGQEQRSINVQAAVVGTDGAEGHTPLSRAGERTLAMNERRPPGSGSASGGGYAMSAVPVRRREDAIPAPALITLGLGGAGMFGGIAIAAARRRRAQVAPARAGR